MNHTTMATKGLQGRINWSTYKDIYDIYCNGTKLKRIYGRKHAIAVGEQQAGGLFGVCRIDVVNIHTGEIIWSSEERRCNNKN